MDKQVKSGRIKSISPSNNLTQNFQNERINRMKTTSHSENSKILPILIQTLYRQVAHPIGFKSIDEIQVSLAPTKIPGNHPRPLLSKEVSKENRD